MEAHTSLDSTCNSDLLNSLSIWSTGCQTNRGVSRIVHYVCLSVCLSVCSLVPSIGKTETMAASSCKEVRDVLSNECSGGPQSGTYWINVTDPHTGDTRTMRVGQRHTSCGRGSCYGSKTCFWDILSNSCSNDKMANCRTFRPRRSSSAAKLLTRYQNCSEHPRNKKHTCSQEGTNLK